MIVIVWCSTKNIKIHVSILLYGCTTWMLTKHIEEKLDEKHTRTLRAILNKSWKQYPRKQQLYYQLPPISKTSQVKRTRHARHNWRSKKKKLRDVLLCTPTNGRASVLTRNYLHRLCTDTGCSLDDLPGAMDDRDGWERMGGNSCCQHDLIMILGLKEN